MTCSYFHVIKLIELLKTIASNIYISFNFVLFKKYYFRGKFEGLVLGRYTF